MPQGRRKVPFSGKAKRDQLKVKKQSKSQHNQQASTSRSNILLKQPSDDESSDSCRIHKLNYQPSKDGRRTNRYALHFHKETDDEISERKELARHTLVPTKNLETSAETYYAPEMDFPKRPQWSFNLSKDQLESQENRYFTEYLKDLDEKFNWKEMGYFELNLETWRQLWRVLEMSDIVLVIVDVRFPSIMFPPSLYEYVTKVLEKSIVLVLNKIDLAPTPLVVAWKHYFEERYPKLKVIMFTTLPSYNLMGDRQDRAGLQIRRRKGRIRMAAEGTKLLLNVCKEIVDGKVDLSAWEQKIQEESRQDFKDDDKTEIGETVILKKTDTSFYRHEPFTNDVLTIGCIGQPNVGKSSLMNAIMGKKVVSVSRTPGHTKHFQTIFLTKNVRLCDCPGLVFPSKVPRELQVLTGSFPIAQLREPFSVIKFIGERLDLPKLLRIEHPDGDDTWSAMDICDGWAKRKGFLTAKAARLDSHRAANSLLRMALDGKISLCLRPPDYAEDQWVRHPDMETVRWVKAITSDEVKVSLISDDSTNCDESDQQESNKESEDEESDENKFAALSTD